MQQKELKCLQKSKTITITLERAKEEKRKEKTAW